MYVYKNEKKVIYILLYVDDIILAGNNIVKMKEVKSSLKNRFKMKELGNLNSFLGIKITRSENGMFLSQSCYLNRLLVRFNMSECKSVGTPMEVKPM